MISFTQNATRYISKLSNKLRRKFDMLSSRKEFSGSQGRTLRFLLSQIEDIYQKDIEEEIQIRKSTVTGILQLMEKNGFIYRESVEKDARLKRIVPTKKAEALRPSILYHINESEAQMTQGISKKDVAVCKQVLLQMLQNLSENKL